MTSVPRFDIFSGDRDNDARWVETVDGLDNAHMRLRELGAQKPGKYFVFSTDTHTVVASIETFAEQKPSPQSRWDVA